MSKAYTTVSTRKTRQTSVIPGREKDMVKNNAGGYSFKVSNWSQLDRFLILGSEGGTYYVSERELTQANAQNVISCIKEDGVRVVNRTVEISDSGRAPKNDPALFVLAMVAGLGNDEARRAALNALPKVARIGTHLFHFAQYVEQFRGWGRALRKAFGNWYLEKSPRKVAEQVTKYVQRDGWSHRDILRLAHPKTSNRDMQTVLKYVTHPESISGALIETQSDVAEYLAAVESLKKETDVSRAVKWITKFNLPREVVPTELLNEPAVWEALMERDMPMTAMIRNIATMTRVGILGPGSSWVPKMVSRLTNVDELRKARIHPISVLLAMKTYSSGHGTRGSNTWTPNQKILDALDEAFYLAFSLVEPTNKRFVLGVDISGSMGWSAAGNAGLDCRTAAAAMSMVTARTEKNYEIMGFSHEFVRLDISPRKRLDDIVNYMNRQPFGGTDCALPMIWAKKHNVETDVFIVYTDNETWAGSIHPVQALKQYRDATGIPAKLIVAAFAGTGTTIADPDDAGMLDIVGFDSSVPTIISDFVSH